MSDSSNFETAYTQAEEMLCAALNDDWDEFSKLQVLQDTLIADFFREKKELTLAEQNELKKLGNIFEQVIDMAESKKSEINDKLIQLKKSKRVQKAYSNNL